MFDWTGLGQLFGKEKVSRFFLTTLGDKNYYPESSNEFVVGRPFEVTIELSKATHSFEQTVYTITDLLIEVGGISRAL